jgi:hypothetical protein
VFDGLDATQYLFKIADIIFNKGRGFEAVFGLNKQWVVKLDFQL